MHRDHSEERTVHSVNTSPRHSSRTSSGAAGSGGLMGLLSKRSTKIQPQSPFGSSDVVHDNAKDDGAFAKSNLHNDSSGVLPQNGINQPKNQALGARPIDDILDADEHEILAKSQSSGFISNFHRKSKTIKLKHSVCHHGTTDGSQSDGGGTSDVVLRKCHNKVKSPNHNRFSHQFSLCCKADKRAATPVTVHYSHNHCGVQGSYRNENMTLSWSSADNPSLPMISSIINPNYDSLQASTRKYIECASAPQSPVSRKCPLFSNSESVATSPSSNSLKNMTDIELSPTDITTALGEGASGGPAIRPLAVSESRSRLRLKLFPPGKEIIAGMMEPSSKLVSTPQQHMSSPNIVSQTEASSIHKGEVLDHVKHSKFHFFSNENVQRQGSSSGLARQALMAAQVLSLIPTDKARERSLLDGCLGPSSLLGPAELIKVLPKKEVFVFIGTWNMNGQNPPKQMNDFVLPVNVEHVPDIVAIGTQESSPDRFDWEVTIQETLGPSHVLFHSTTLGTLHLAIFLRRDLIWYCSAPEEASFSVRTGSAFRTKGAVAISFCLFGTSMLFVTSHLTAHQQKVKERVSDVKRIIHALDLPRNLNLRHKNKDVTQNFDNVFWCGDLNFRLGEPREKLLEWIQNTKFPLPSHLPNGYMHTDQLSSVLADGAAFRGFMEANITFPPTYKYDPGTQHFDTSSKQRAPAYTDRILYKFRQNQGLTIRPQSMLPGMSPEDVNHPNVECLLYDSVPSITTSDHKPVWALFKTSIRAGTDSIPLAAGLFCRDVYLEGMKKRLHNEYSDSSAVCSIQ